VFRVVLQALVVSVRLGARNCQRLSASWETEEKDEKKNQVTPNKKDQQHNQQQHNLASVSLGLGLPSVLQFREGKACHGPRERGQTTHTEKKNTRPDNEQSDTKRQRGNDNARRPGSASCERNGRRMGEKKNEGWVTVTHSTHQKRFGIRPVTSPKWFHMEKVGRRFFPNFLLVSGCNRSIEFSEEFCRQNASCQRSLPGKILFLFRSISSHVKVCDRVLSKVGHGAARSQRDNLYWLASDLASLHVCASSSASSSSALFTFLSSWDIYETSVG